MHFSSHLGALCALSWTAAAAPWDDLLRNFSSPTAAYRPKFRYWLPDASADTDAVREDIRTIASSGAGGFEFLPYYQPGGPPASNWSEYGYGSQAYLDIFRAAMETAEEEGLLMDFAVSPNQGQGVPAQPESLGLAVHLSYSNVTLAPGQVFDDILPLSSQPHDPGLFFMHELEEFGSQLLFAVLAVEIIPHDPLLEPYRTVNRIVDLTSEVSPGTRSLTWRAPKSQRGSTWRIMAWYERYTNQRSIGAGPGASSLIQNGSWIVDHFSSHGSKLMTDFFDNYVIPDQRGRDMLARVGKYAWEDSMEMNSVLWWTPGLEKAFQKEHGYDIRQCLPFLLNRENAWAQLYIPHNEGFLSVNSSLGITCNRDYRLVLQRGYEEYVRGYVHWAHELGIEYSNQPAYNLPLSMVDSALLPDAPEVESFGFQDRIEAYRHMSGPAHLAGNPVVSSELGAVPRAAYSQSLSNLLRSFHRGLSGGISMNVLHGYPYTGPCPNTTWPGVTIFGFMYSEMWGPRQPTWASFPDMMAYMGRSQYVIQAGVPKVDLAIYSNDAPWTLGSGYTKNDLEAAGYTYDYVGPNILAKSSFSTQDGILGPDGPAYKAMIILNETRFTTEAALRVRDLAEGGLPIIFYGEAEAHSDTSFGRADAIVQEVKANTSFTVFEIQSTDDLVKALGDAGIRPNVRFHGARSGQAWYSFWRSTEDAELVWLFKDDDGSTFTSETVEVEFSGMNGTVPFKLEPWTGSAQPVSFYSHGHGTLTIPITSSANQTTMLAFRKIPQSLTKAVQPGPVIKSISGSVAGISHLPNTQGKVQTCAQLRGGLASIQFSNNTWLRVNAAPPKRAGLDTWRLRVESWHRTANDSSFETEIDVFDYAETNLTSWLQLDPQSLADVSGIGRYSIQFPTPSSNSNRRLGAFLHLGRFRESLRLWLNGVALPSRLYQAGSDSVVDLTEHLRGYNQTDNALEIEVATSLFNRIRTEANITESLGIRAGNPQGSGPYFANTPAIEQGLIGPVWVEWLEILELA